MQPFNNYDVSMDMTGPQILTLLDQQWSGANAAQPEDPAGLRDHLHLQPSPARPYTLDPGR